MRSKWPRSSATGAGDWSLFRRRPRRPLWPRRRSPPDCHCSSVTMTSPSGAASAPSANAVQWSSASSPSLSSGIELLLEGRVADPRKSIVEALAVAALLQVGGDDAADRVDHPVVGEGGPDRSEEHTSELQSLMRISY